MARPMGALGVVPTALLRLLITALLREVGDRRYDRPHDLAPDYDFIVVGGGSAGSVMAARLAEAAGWRVLLLEAGAKQPAESRVPALNFLLFQSDADWNYRSQSQQYALKAYKDNSIPYPRGRGAGGSSSINSMIYVRGNRRDYDQWEELGNPGWGYNSVLKYFKKSEDFRGGVSQEADGYHGFGGPQTVENKKWNSTVAEAFLKAGQQLGYSEVDPNGPEQIGFSIIDITARNGRRWSTGDGYLRPAALKKTNLHVVLKAHVLKILFDEKKNAVGVSFEQKGKVRTVKALKEVVLSAGAIGSPQLLLLSGVGPADHLHQHGIPVVADVAGVGQNLQDHPAVGGLVWTVGNRSSSVNFLSFFNPKNIHDFIHQAKGPLTSPTGTEGNAWLPSAVGEPLWPEIQLALVTGTPSQDRGRLTPRIFGYKEEVYKDYYGDILGLSGFTLVPVLNRPLSRGTLTLASPNPYDHPLINLNFLHHPDDVTTLIRGIELALKVGETPAFTKDLSAKFHDKVLSGCQHEKAYTDAYWACYTRYMATSAYHACGTCKMGPFSDTLAVVDHRLRLRGVSGVRVVDASIMPLIISGNTNAATIMIAEKAADLLKHDWLLSDPQTFI